MNARWEKIRETYFGNIGDALVWLSLVLIVLWALAKAFGLINTPLIIELAPIILMAFAGGRFFQEQKEFKKEMRQFKNETHRELSLLSGRILLLELTEKKART